jgi:hypothetical protein
MPGFQMGDWFNYSPELRSVRYVEPFMGDLQSLVGQFAQDPLAKNWEDADVDRLDQASPEDCAQFLRWLAWGEKTSGGFMLYHQENIGRALRRILQTCPAT